MLTHRTKDEQYTGFVYYLNIFYFTIITLTTVGYGDYFPVTLMGKTIAFFIFIWGVFLVSLVFVLLMSSLEMNHKERNALNLIRRISINLKRKQQSALSITRFFRIICLYKRFKKERSENLEKRLQSEVYMLKDSLKNQIKLRKEKDVFKENNVLQSLIDHNHYSKWFLRELSNKQLIIIEDILKLKENFQSHRKTRKMTVFLNPNNNFAKANSYVID